MSTVKTVKVLIVDDHNMFVDGLTAALDQREDITVVGTAATGHQALAALGTQRPDVVLLDQVLPDEDGVDVAASMLEIQPSVRIIVISQLVDAYIAEKAVGVGCIGYLTKDKPLEELISAIRGAAAGEAVMSPGLLNKMFERMRTRRVSKIVLSKRELEVLQLMADGLTTAGIARSLTLSLSTIRNHVHSVIQKLGAHSRLEAVVIALREGLVHPPSRDGD